MEGGVRGWRGVEGLGGWREGLGGGRVRGWRGVEGLG